MSYYNNIIRFACFAAALIVVISLFWVGAKPVAVGLFPSGIDKIAHFSTFGLIAALLWMSILRGWPLTLIAIVGAIGAADEFHQSFLPGRSASLGDMAVDLFAVVTVAAFMEYARRRKG